MLDDHRLGWSTVDGKTFLLTVNSRTASSPSSIRAKGPRLDMSYLPHENKRLISPSSCRHTIPPSHSCLHTISTLSLSSQVFGLAHHSSTWHRDFFLAFYPLLIPPSKVCNSAALHLIQGGLIMAGSKTSISAAVWLCG